MSERMAEKLQQVHALPLENAIITVGQEFSGALTMAPRPRNDTLVNRGNIIESQGFKCDSSAACSVLNAIACLGITPEQTPESLIENLVTLSKDPEPTGKRPNFIGPSFLEKVGDVHFPTTMGIVQLFNVAELRTDLKKLPLTVRRLKNMGQAHEALAHGCTAVAVDEPSNQTVAIGGVYQAHGQVEWVVATPNLEAENIFDNLKDAQFPFLHQSVSGFVVNPEKLTSRFKEIIWAVGHQNNDWLANKSFKVSG